MKFRFRRKRRFDFNRLLFHIRSFLEILFYKAVRFFRIFTGKVRRQAAISQLKKGDIILASPLTRRLTFISLFYRVLLKSHYTHSMLYIGNGKIIHTTDRFGVIVTRVPRKIYRPDIYSVYRIKKIDDSMRDAIVTAAFKWQKHRLDRAGLVKNLMMNLFRLKKPVSEGNKNKIWCSKMIYLSYLFAGIELLPKNQAEHITSDTLSKSYLLERVRV